MKKQRERYRIGLELLGETDGLTILDAGCGFGTLEASIDAVGLDQSAYNITQCLKIGSRKKFVRGMLENMPLASAAFDVVILLETLEHVADEGKCLQEIRRVLKKSGRLILSVPNDHLLYNLIDLEHWLIPLLTGRPSHRHYKKNRLKCKLEEHGFSVERSFERGWIFSAVLRWFLFCFDMIDRFFWGGFNGPCGRGIRRIMDPAIDAEFRVPTCYGHSLFVVATKVV